MYIPAPPTGQTDPHANTTTRTAHIRRSTGENQNIIKSLLRPNSKFKNLKVCHLKESKKKVFLQVDNHLDHNYEVRCMCK